MEFEQKYRFLSEPCDCTQCQIDPFPVIYHINQEQYWTMIPRNGSSSMRSTYAWLVVPHDKIVNHGVVKPIVIYRDPVDRFVSLLDHYFNGAVGRSVYGRDWMLEVANKDLLSLDPVQRVATVFENLDQLWRISQRHHFYEQTKYIATDYFDEYTMVPLSEASKILHIPKTHESIKIINISCLTKDHINLIHDIYKNDYEFFNLRKKL